MTKKHIRPILIILFSGLSLTFFYLFFFTNSSVNPKTSQVPNTNNSPADSQITEIKSDQKGPENTPSTSEKSPTTKPTASPTTKATITPPQPSTPSPETSETKVYTKTEATKEDIEVTLKIRDGSPFEKTITIPKDSKLIDLLDNAAAHNLITYDTKTYPTGKLVESINGLKNDKLLGKYWTYYINDKFATVGISQQTLSAGDIIDWHYGYGD